MGLEVSVGDDVGESVVGLVEGRFDGETVGNLDGAVVGDVVVGDDDGLAVGLDVHASAAVPPRSQTIRPHTPDVSPTHPSAALEVIPALFETSKFSKSTKRSKTSLDNVPLKPESDKKMPVITRDDASCNRRLLVGVTTARHVTRGHKHGFARISSPKHTIQLSPFKSS